jgi:CBS domain-containing protein
MARRSSPSTPTPADLLAHHTVSEGMRFGLFTCTPDADIRELAAAMAEHSIHSVVVAGIERRDRGGEHLSWGIVSDLDLIRALRPGGDEATAGELAGTEVITIAPDETLEGAVQLMAEHDAAHLVVVSPQTGLPVGMLSTLDIARALT